MNHQHKHFKPLYDRVLIRRVAETEKLSGAIEIPDAAKEPPLEGVVLAIGHGRLNADGTVTPLRVAPGRSVLFGKYAGTDIVIDGETLLIMREEEILGELHPHAEHTGGILQHYSPEDLGE